MTAPEVELQAENVIAEVLRRKHFTWIGSLLHGGCRVKFNVNFMVVRRRIERKYLRLHKGVSSPIKEFYLQVKL